MFIARPISFCTDLSSSHVNVGGRTLVSGLDGAAARIKFDDEQFAALFNELQARGDKAKLNGVMDNVERLEKRITFLRAHEKKMERIALIKAVHEERKAKM